MNEAADDHPVPMRKRKTLAAAALLLLAVGLVFAQALGFSFVALDDPIYVTDNSRVLAGLGWENLRWAFTTQFAGLWHPLAWLSHMADVSLWDTWAGGHHLSSLLLHAGAAVLLFMFLFHATGSFWRSLLVAALFAAHPTRAESVAWVAERKDVLCAFFWMATLVAWGRWWEGRRTRWLASALAAFALALLAKPMAVALPPILLGLALWPLRARTSGLPGRRLLAALPFFGLALAVGLVTLLHPFATSMPDSLAVQTGMGERLEVAAAALARYLWKLLWPLQLSFLHPERDPAPTAWAWAGLLLFAALVTLAWRTRRTRPWLTVGIWWFLVALLPVSGLLRIGEYSHADRYTYLPYVGLFIALAWSLPAAWFRGLPGRIAAGALGAAVLALAAWQVSHWQDSGRLTARALELYPGQERIALFRVEWLVEQGRAEEALTLAGTLAPAAMADIPRSQLFLHVGDAHRLLGDSGKALYWWQRALQSNRWQWPALARSGRLHLKEGRPLEAANAFAAGLRIVTDDAGLWADYGEAAAQLGEHTLAFGAWGRAVELEPGRLVPRLAAARLLAATGRTDEARQAYRELLARAPDHPEAAQESAALEQSAEAPASPQAK